MSDIEAEMMDEWRRTRYIKAAGPSDSSDPQPTLTDAEREAVSVARDAYADDDGNAECEEIAAVLSRLLERLK